MQLEVTEDLKEALGKYQTARRAYVSLGNASQPGEVRQVRDDYQAALENLGYKMLVEVEHQGLKV